MKGKYKTFFCYLGNKLIVHPKIFCYAVYMECSLWAVYYFVVCLGVLSFVTKILKLSTWMKLSGITIALSLISKLFREQDYPMGKAQTMKTPASESRKQSLIHSVPTFFKGDSHEQQREILKNKAAAKGTRWWCQVCMKIWAIFTSLTAYGIEIWKTKQDWKKPDEWDGQKDLQTSLEGDEQRVMLPDHTDICKHGRIRAQKSQWGAEWQKGSGNTNGFRKEDVYVKQRKSASTAIRKKAELWYEGARDRTPRRKRLMFRIPWARTREKHNLHLAARSRR